MIEIGLEKDTKVKKTEENLENNENNEAIDFKNLMDDKSFNRSLKIMERMINKNKDAHIY